MLRWSKFHYIENKLDGLVFGFDIYVNTKSLTISTLPQSQTYRLNLMKQLHNNGCTNKEISDHFNKKNIKSPNGNLYNPGLIWCTLDKLKKRESRMKLTDIKITDPCFYEYLDITN